MRKWIGWLVYNQEDAQRNQPYIDWMLREAEDLGLTLRLVYREQVYAGIRNGVPSIWLEGGLASAPDFAIVRTIEPTLNAQFEQLGIATYNSSHVARICNNKALTHQYLSQFSIPMLDTLFSSTRYLTASGSSLYPFPFVVKTVSGRGGREVRLVEEQSQLEDFISAFPNTEVIVQALGPVPGKDLRVFVVGKKVAGAVLRSSTSGDFRANYSLGGHADKYVLTEMQEALVRRIISHFQFGLVGIDFLFDTHGGLIFNEIEDVVGSRTLSQVDPDANLVRQYLSFIKGQLDNGLSF